MGLASVWGVGHGQEWRSDGQCLVQDRAQAGIVGKAVCGQEEGVRVRQVQGAGVWPGQIGFMSQEGGEVS